MKVRQILLLAAVGGLFLSSCSHDKKATPEDEVRRYGKYFVEKLSANQLDSLKSSYPDLSAADSVMKIQSDTILVADKGSGKYDVTLAEGITLKVSRADDGKISVTESHGLFAFPADKLATAKKTGLWDASLTDKQLSERMKDDGFFAYIKSKQPSAGNIITIGKFVSQSDGFGGTGYYTLTNNSDVAISGTDYTISVVSTYPTYEPEAPNAVADWVTKKSSEPGKDIAPKGSVKITSEIVHTFAGGDIGPEKELKGIQWKLSPEQLQEKFASFTGKEYQEYLNTKK